MPPPSDDSSAVAEQSSGVLDETDGRIEHFGHFYGRHPLPDGAGIVIGNCQAESVRIVVDTPVTPTVRVPPVHELEPADLPHFERVVSRAAFIVSQPIRDDYRGLPVGTRQVRERARPGAKFLLIPNVRFAGLHPFQLALHIPGHTDPPLVAYQDVRDLAAVAGIDVRATLAAASVHAIAAESVDQLRQREEANATLRISDVFDRPGFDLVRTVNHAGNRVWLELGARVLDALDADAAPTDPGRPLLASVIAPRLDWVAEAWGLEDEGDPDWTVGGITLPADEVREAQRRWYGERPDYVRTALERSADVLRHWTTS